MQLLKRKALMLPNRLGWLCFASKLTDKSEALFITAIQRHSE